MAYTSRDQEPPYKFPWGEFEHHLMPLLSMPSPPSEDKAIALFRRLYDDDTEARWKFERIWAARGWIDMMRDEIRKTEYWKPVAPGRYGLDGDFLWGLHKWLVNHGEIGAVPLPTVEEVVLLAKTAQDIRAAKGIE